MLQIMKKILTIALLFTITLSNAQSIKRGYKNLEKKEYDKAKETFEKLLAENKDNIAANFGLALDLADDQSSVFNIINSWQYIEKIRDKTDRLSQEDIDIIGEFFYNTEERHTNRPVKKKIEIAVEAIEDRLIKYIREENNLDAVYEVLNRYPNFRFYNNVIHIRNQFEFRKYEKQNTLEGYEEYMKKFPDAAQVEKANKYRNKLAFDKAKTQNTIGAYTTYIATFPESEYLQTAIKLRNAVAFSEAKKQNTLEAYENFIKTYPDALEVSEAKTLQQDLLYAQAKRIKSIEAYNDFIHRYPEGRYYVDVFNLKAAELGMQFAREYNFNNQSVLWVRAFDNKGQIESSGTVAITQKGEYVVACNTRESDTAYTDAWIIKLDAEGKMMWNKFVGQAFEDSVASVLVDSKGDIIIVGYTYLTAECASKMGWMFKLAADGKKLWNRNLGKIDVQSCATDDNDRIFIGGGTAKDTLASHYELTIFDENAKILSQRIYAGKGRINDLRINSEGNLLVSGSNWLALLDSKKYVLWEDTIKSSLEAYKCAFSVDGGYFYTGTGRESIFYTKYNSFGKKSWFLEYSKTDSTHVIRDIASVNKNLIVLEQKSDGAKIKMISFDSKILGVKELINGIQLNHIESDPNGLIILLSFKDLVVIKFSNLMSL
jgi:hypothetical protein